MRVIRFGVLVGVMAVLACSAAFAQRPGGGRPGGMMQLTVAQVPAAVLEQPLQLTADQKTKITAIQTKLQEDRRAAFGQGGGQRDQAAMRAAFQKLQEQGTKASQDVEALLTADQKAKLPELLKKLQALQTAGIPYQTYGDLKLTDEQMGKIQKLADDFTAKMRQAMQAAGGGNAGGGGNNPAFQQMRTDRDAMQKEAQALLTDAQKAVVEKYNKENPQRGQRGGQGGQRPQRGGNR